MSRTTKRKKTPGRRAENRAKEILPARRTSSLAYQREEDRIFSLQREELEAELEKELEGIEADDEMGRALLIPDGEDDDPEVWEPDDHVRESEDEDTGSTSVEPEDFLWQPGQRPVAEQVLEEQVPRPDVEVVREETLHGSSLSVRPLGKTYHPAKPVLREKRRRLVEVVEYVSQFQRDFFDGRGGLKRLNEADIARQLWPGENLNTKKEDLSHLISSAWVRLPWGDVVRLSDLCPSSAVVLLDEIKSILHEHDLLEVQNGRAKATRVIPVYSSKGLSVVSELRKRMPSEEGCSPENIKYIMQRAGIPRGVRERTAAYESGAAWWR